MLRHFFVILFIMLSLPTTFAQSVVWDEKTKTWISPPAPAVTATPPTVTPQPQPQQQTTIPTPQYIQTMPTTPTAPAAAVDLGTLTAVITPLVAAISGIFIKNRKDMEKKDEETKRETIKAIEQAIIPKINQIVPLAEQTAKQDVKFNQLAEELYKVMAEKANEIHDKPEIQQQKLIEDAVRSRLIAEQTKQQINTTSVQWDEATKSWVSK